MRALLALLIAAALAGCASGPRVLVEPLTDLEGRASADTVAVYAAPDDIALAFEEIALLSVTSGERPLQAGAARERNLAALVEKAKALGADALIVTDNYDPTLFIDGSDDPQRADRVEQAREQTDRGTVSRAVWTTKATAIVYR